MMFNPRKRKNPVSSIQTQLPSSTASKFFLDQFRSVIKRSKSTIKKEKNGISFYELVAINNAMVMDDLDAFKKEIKKLKNINYFFRFNEEDFDMVDWDRNFQFGRSSSEIKMTLLHLAARRAKIDFIQTLIKEGADINLYSYKKLTTVKTDQRTPLQDLYEGSINEKDRESKNFKRCEALLNDNVKVENSFLRPRRSF